MSVTACARDSFAGRQQLAVPLYLGGHSKGGNLAMYAAIREQTIQPAITRVYNFDGPGFRPSFYERYDCTAILDRIHTYVPKDSDHRPAAQPSGRSDRDRCQRERIVPA